MGKENVIIWPYLSQFKTDSADFVDWEEFLWLFRVMALTNLVIPQGPRCFQPLKRCPGMTRLFFKHDTPFRRASKRHIPLIKTVKYRLRQGRHLRGVGVGSCNLSTSKVK